VIGLTNAINLIDGLDGLADTDGDGLVDALDPDSDNDGLYDGTEAGVTAAITTTTFWTAFATNILLSGISSALPSEGR
jgi:hypothetical protein